MLQSEAVSVACGLQPRCSVDEKEGVGDVVFCAQFTEKPLCEGDRTPEWSRTWEKFVGFGIDRRHQLVAVVVQPNHRFVHRDVSRRFAVRGLESGLAHSVVDGGVTPDDAETIENEYSI